MSPADDDDHHDNDYYYDDDDDDFDCLEEQVKQWKTAWTQAQSTRATGAGW